MRTKKAKSRILFFTPTKPDRIADSFLDPVRQRHKEMWRFMEATNDVERIVDASIGQARAYDTMRSLAVDGHYDWILAIEDDELPPINTLDLFLDAQERISQENGSADVLTGTKWLREASLKLAGSSYPWIWHMGIYGIDHIEPIRPGRQEAYIKIVGGTVATPLLVRPDFLDRFKIRFHDDDGRNNWDYCFGMDLYKQRLPFYCVPGVHTKHYCVDHRRIYP